MSFWRGLKQGARLHVEVKEICQQGLGLTPRQSQETNPIEDWSRVRDGGRLGGKFRAAFAWQALQPIKRSNLSAVIPLRLPWIDRSLVVAIDCKRYIHACPPQAHPFGRTRLNELCETTVRKTA
jgi:hypothetical protein